MADWEVLQGGRVKRFRNRQTRHACGKRLHGRPSVGRGLCYVVNAARAQRRAMNAQLRTIAYDPTTFAEFTLVVPPYR